MKKVFLSIILVAGITFGSFASPQKGGPRKGDSSRLTKELNLTTDQQEKIKSLNNDFRAQFDQLRKDTVLTKDAKREKMKSLSENRESQLQSVLTSEQQTKWKELREKKPMAPRKDRKDFAKKGRDFKNELNLTEDQKTKIQELRKDFKSKAKVLADDTSLSKDAKREKRKELAVAHRSEIQSLLTPDQQAKMKDAREKGKKDFKQRGKHSAKKGNRDKRMNLDTETMAKLDVLKKDFSEKIKAVELSRIAPEVQKEQIKDLKEKYRTDRRDIIKDARQKKGDNKPS